MNWQSLDSEIEWLESLVDKAGRFKVETEWAELWAKSHEIQGAFNTGVMYPSKPDRDRAWVRFNAARGGAHFLYRQYKEDRSKEVYRQILVLLKHAHYDWTSQFFDKTVFALDPTTSEDMIAKGASLKQAWQLLSANKEHMLKEHKDDCYGRLRDTQDYHDAWWNRQKENWAERRADREAKQTASRAKAKSNIAANEARLEKAESALNSMEESAEKIRSDIESAWNDDWKERAEGRLEELEAKIEKTRSFIREIKTWIEQDEAKL